MKEEESTDLVVPFALDDEGAQVRPEVADRDASYRCPDCGERVILKRGPIKRVHFAHLPDLTQICDFAAGETEDHHRAKARIAQAVASREPVHLCRTCTECRRRVWESLPRCVSHADLEHVLPSGHRLDVALLDVDGQLVAALEVRALHAVDDTKAKILDAVIPWAEIEAGEILGCTDWQLLRDHLLPTRCNRCEAMARFGGWYRLVRPLLVACPIPSNLRPELRADGRAHLFRDCACCEHFEDFDGQAVTCTGKGQAVVSRGAP